jgi:phosphoglycerate dehydrogenase-like enzyme
MRQLAVCCGFLTEDHRRDIDAAAREAGFAVTYYPSGKALTAHIGDYEVIFGQPVPGDLKQAKNLKWVCTDFAGVDRFTDEALWPDEKCLLSNSSGAYGPTISEHILMVLLMLLRRYPEYQADLQDRKWTYHAPIRSINGSHIVMLGAGDIGSHAARRLKALGATVTGVCRSGKSSEPAFDEVLPVSRLDEALPTADALVMALPGTAATAGILSRERIKLLPRKALVINVGRGSAIDQEALVDALNAHAIAGAALDVMVPEPLPEDHPLWRCPNTILTPHISGNMSLGLTCDLAVKLFCDDLRRYGQGLPPERLVDRKLGY